MKNERLWDNSVRFRTKILGMKNDEFKIGPGSWLP